MPDGQKAPTPTHSPAKSATPTPIVPVGAPVSGEALTPTAIVTPTSSTN
jgi:hypothetical protein